MFRLIEDEDENEHEEEKEKKKKRKKKKKKTKKIALCQRLSDHTSYATKKKLHKPRVRANTGKKKISFKAIDLWKSIPQNIKDLNVYRFSKNIKKFILSEKYSKKPVS